MNPPHPGTFLATEVIRPLELSVAAAAKVLSGDMALRVEQAFGVRMDTLMRMQSPYDIARTRERQHTIRVRRYHASEARR